MLLFFLISTSFAQVSSFRCVVMTCFPIFLSFYLNIFFVKFIIVFLYFIKKIIMQVLSTFFIPKSIISYFRINLDKVKNYSQETIFMFNNFFFMLLKIYLFFFSIRLLLCLIFLFIFHGKLNKELRFPHFIVWYFLNSNKTFKKIKKNKNKVVLKDINI